MFFFLITLILFNDKIIIKCLNNSLIQLLQAKRKQERMIRNRESAYLSRKRKKEHVAHLEKLVKDLIVENNALKTVNIKFPLLITYDSHFVMFPIQKVNIP